LFAYPASTKPPKKETITKAVTAVLSTAARVKAREKKRAATEGEAMDVVSPLSETSFYPGFTTCLEIG